MVGKSAVLFVSCGCGLSALLDDEDAMLQMVHLGDRMRDLTSIHSQDDAIQDASADIAEEREIMDLALEQAMMDADGDDPQYVVGKPGVAWPDSHYWKKIANDAGFGDQDECPENTDRVTDLTECWHLMNTVISWDDGPGHDKLKVTNGPGRQNLQEISGPRLPLKYWIGRRCDNHVSRNVGCSVNTNGWLIHTRDDCANYNREPLGNPYTRPICKVKPPTPAPTPAPTPEPAPAPAGAIKWFMLSAQTQATLQSERHDGTAKCEAFCSGMGMECTEDVNLGDWKPATDGTLKYETEQGEVTCDTARTWTNNFYPRVDLTSNPHECQYVEGPNARPASQRMFCRLNIVAGALCPCQQTAAPVVWTALSTQTQTSLQEQAGNTQSVSCNALCSSMHMGCQDNWNTSDWKPAADGSLKFTIHDFDQSPTVTSCQEIIDGGSSNFYPYAEHGLLTGHAAGTDIKCTYVTASWWGSPRSCSRGGSPGNLCPCLLTAEALQAHPQLEEAR